MRSKPQTNASNPSSNFSWKIIKPKGTERVKFKMMARPATTITETAGGQVRAEIMPIVHDSHTTTISQDESGSSSGHSELFDRASSNTGTDDTAMSSISSRDHDEADDTVIKIEDVPVSYQEIDTVGSARKRVAISGDHSVRHTPVSKPATTPMPASLEADAISLAISPGKRLTIAKAKATPTKCAARDPRASWRAGSSIPQGLPWDEYGRQCVLAATSSRLNPYALHTGEHRLLRDKICPQHVTAYLNIRNGILRLWTRNPVVCVTLEEAAGCAKHARYFGLAEFAYRWLIRNGYINFGCMEPLRSRNAPPRMRKSAKQKTIVVVGAGMAGLGCARQLETLIAHHQDDWAKRGEHPPRVLVVEGRRRIGGRVYSHPLKTQVTDSLPDGMRNTAEMGAQIITGFQHGNPLDIIVRGQLGLHYHLMWDEIVMHDSDGKAVNHERDLLVNKIHNDILERTSEFRLKPTSNDTLEGMQDHIDACQEPAYSDIKSETATVEAVQAEQDRLQVVPPGFAKLQGRTQVVAGNSSTRTAAQAARIAGWELRPGITRGHSLNLKAVVDAAKKPTLGSTLDEAIRQYQHLVQLTPQDMRMLNWHHADLEYANAALVHNLSLSGHDQDSGNEFEGRHSEVVGGYIQVPRGLMMLPHRLEVEFEKPVRSIKYSSGNDGAAVVETSSGEEIHAEKVILTAPLGVLKSGAIALEPKLPSWKQGAIDRLGFGLLNKIVLVFERPFWNEHYDMFGLLNDAEQRDSLDPDAYAEGRGKFYLVWNCISNSGRPMLIALMSGHAAHAAEVTPTQVLLKEIMARLSKTFAPEVIPAPVEVIVTRWRQDPFTRGTYSFVAPGTEPGDYDVMAQPIGNLHFAGEATCGTHPATVHGAYLSGLRAAAEIIDSLLGPITVPDELVSGLDSDYAHLERKPPTTKPARPAAGSRIKAELPADAVPAPSNPTPNPYRHSTSSTRAPEASEREADLRARIYNAIGERPLRPARPGVNPFLVYTAEKWSECKERCTREKQAATGKEDAKATRNEVRVAIGRDWRVLDEDTKSAYVQRCEEAQRRADQARAEYEAALVRWDAEAARIRAEYGRGVVVPEVVAAAAEVVDGQEMADAAGR